MASFSRSSFSKLHTGDSGLSDVLLIKETIRHKARLLYILYSEVWGHDGKRFKFYSYIVLYGCCWERDSVHDQHFMLHILQGSTHAFAMATVRQSCRSSAVQDRASVVHGSPLWTSSTELNWFMLHLKRALITLLYLVFIYIRVGFCNIRPIMCDLACLEFALLPKLCAHC